MNNKAGALLGSVCIFGLVVSFILGGAVILLSYMGGIPLFTFSHSGKTSFTQALEEYDEKLRENPSLPFRQRNALLDGLEKKALDTENVLSVLKRRRSPAMGAGDQYLSAYGEAAERARKLYPYSGQIGALAAEALILRSPVRPLSEAAAAEIRDLGILMSQGALQDLSLAFSIYSGAMADPASARFLPRELFSLLCSLTQGTEREKYLVNSCIRTLLEGDPREAISMVNSLFDSPAGVEGNPFRARLRNETYLFGGEFFYDHGNFLRAAELFSVFNDDRFFARQGDALWLAGFTDSARGLWKAAAARTEETVPSGETGASVRDRSLYNLASSASAREEESRWLELLFALRSEYQPGRVFGIVRYSRLVPLDRALTILSQGGEDEGLFELEILRRKSGDWTADRTVAETWLLLNRHPGDGRLYEWAAWYFDFQHRYDETAMVLKNAGINRAEGPWSALHRAFAQVRENSLDDAEKLLRGIVRAPGEGRVPGARQPLWQAAADLGLLLDIRRQPQEALQYYEIAAGLLAAGLEPSSEGIPAAGTSPEKRDAARIQLHIARCLKALGREQECLRILEYALDLDPENLEARFELRRLGMSRSIL